MAIIYFITGCFLFCFTAVNVCNCLVHVLLHFVNLYVRSSLSEDGRTVPPHTHPFRNKIGCQPDIGVSKHEPSVSI